MIDFMLNPVVIIVAFGLAQLADLLATMRALKQPGAREANPIFAFFMAATFMWPLVKIVGASAVVAVLWWSDALPWAWAVTVVTSGVAFNNWRITCV